MAIHSWNTISATNTFYTNLSYSLFLFFSSVPIDPITTTQISLLSQEAEIPEFDRPFKIMTFHLITAI